MVVPGRAVEFCPLSLESLGLVVWIGGRRGIIVSLAAGDRFEEGAPVHILVRLELRIVSLARVPEVPRAAADGACGITGAGHGAVVGTLNAAFDSALLVVPGFEEFAGLESQVDRAAQAQSPDSGAGDAAIDGGLYESGRLTTILLLTAVVQHRYLLRRSRRNDAAVGLGMLKDSPLSQRRVAVSSELSFGDGDVSDGAGVEREHGGDEHDAHQELFDRHGISPSTEVDEICSKKPVRKSSGELTHPVYLISR